MRAAASRPGWSARPFSWMARRSAAAPARSPSPQPRYRLQAVGRGDDGVGCAVYGAPGLDRDEVMRVSDERDYARRFGVRLDLVE